MAELDEPPKVGDHFPGESTIPDEEPELDVVIPSTRREVRRRDERSLLVCDNRLGVEYSDLVTPDGSRIVVYMRTVLAGPTLVPKLFRESTSHRLGPVLLFSTISIDVEKKRDSEQGSGIKVLCELAEDIGTIVIDVADHPQRTLGGLEQLLIDSTGVRELISCFRTGPNQLRPIHGEHRIARCWLPRRGESPE